MIELTLSVALGIILVPIALSLLAFAMHVMSKLVDMADEAHAKRK